MIAERHHPHRVVDGRTWSVGLDSRLLHVTAAVFVVGMPSADSSTA
ncbi:hypothetical protein ACFXKR_38815 [Streptomyces violascens]